ncbi:putative portal protein [Rheinheimera phage vB_RspM_Barba31A]|uniref:Putative portal protein n=1 Tax=Rheinheimera phage vB_RspM_Barba31A TaxID=2565682 RepID=A0A4P8NE03_9CAUD|nr:putative portal protein [Rheinheimera phage vB_RspM_Barba31A]
MEEENLNLEKGDNPVPRIRMSEYGTTGLKVFSDQIFEEDRPELRGTGWIKEVRKMRNDPVVSAGVELLQMWMQRGIPEIVPYSESEEDVKRAKFIEQCMYDMEHTFDDLMKDITSNVWYGYAPIEKVFKKRLANQSKYNDGLIGWKKLPIRSQDTVVEWKTDDTGRNITHLIQDINSVTSGERLNRLLFTYPAGEVEIPMEKVLNFRYNGTRGNPEGRSPCKSIWGAYKYRCQIELDEAIGVQRNLNGVPVYYAPAQYMSPDAKPHEKAVYESIKNQIRNYQNNEQAGFVIPNIYDEHSKQRLFSLEPLEVKGSNQYNTNDIIKRYDLKILTMLFADILMMGQTSTGSFALSGSKTNLVEMNIQRRLQEIATVFEQDLFKQTFELNGWDSKRLPTIKFTFPEDHNPDEFGKLIQRIGSINFIPRTPDMVGWVAKAMGYPDWKKFAEMEQKELDELFTDNESGSGEGQGSSGTGTTQSGGASSSTNSNNAS